MLNGVSSSAVQSCNTLRVAKGRALRVQQQGAGEYGHFFLAHLQLDHRSDVAHNSRREWGL